MQLSSDPDEFISGTDQRAQKSGPLGLEERAKIFTTRTHYQHCEAGMVVSVGWAQFDARLAGSIKYFEMVGYPIAVTTIRYAPVAALEKLFTILTCKLSHTRNILVSDARFRGFNFHKV